MATRAQKFKAESQRKTSTKKKPRKANRVAAKPKAKVKPDSNVRRPRARKPKATQ